MGRAYSLDLRQRSLIHYNEYGDLRNTAELFGVNVETIRNWGKRQRAGLLKANKSGPKGFKKLDGKALYAYIKDHQDLNLHELADIFKVSHVCIWNALKKQGYVYKKNHGYTKKEMRAVGCNI